MSKYFSQTSIPSPITSQFLWFNENIDIDGKCIYFEQFSINEINFVGNLFKCTGNVKLWFKNIDFPLLQSKIFQRMQLKKWFRYILEKVNNRKNKFDNIHDNNI